MGTGDYALLISGVSIAISVCGFVWNIWQKFIFVRPEVHVSFNISAIYQGGKKLKEICSLTATNMGPGPVVIQACVVKFGRPWRAWWRPRIHGVLNPLLDPMDPRAEHLETGPFANLPVTLEAGQLRSFYFPFTENCDFMKEPFTHIGVSDTYQRNNWGPRKHARKAHRKFNDRFPGAAKRLLRRHTPANDGWVFAIAISRRQLHLATALAGAPL